MRNCAADLTSHHFSLPLIPLFATQRSLLRSIQIVCKCAPASIRDTANSSSFCDEPRSNCAFYTDYDSTDCCPRPEVAGWERNFCYFFSRLNLEKSERSYCALRGSCTSAGIIFFGKVISEVVSEWTCQLCARAEEEIKYSVSFVAKIFSIFFPHCPFAVSLFHFLCDQWYWNDIRLYSRIIEYNSVENNSPPLIIPCLASTLP